VTEIRHLDRPCGKWCRARPLSRLRRRAVVGV